MTTRHTIRVDADTDIHYSSGDGWYWQDHTNDHTSPMFASAVEALADYTGTADR